jgi:hypothetical protein
MPENGDMTPSTFTAVRIHAIPVYRLQAVRESGLDVSGIPVESLVASGGEPLRCCLRNARAGEECLLFGYDPPLPGGPTPYREIGAVYAHSRTCDGPRDEGYPADWRNRPQTLRAYDASGWIHPATTTSDGTDPGSALAAVLTTPGVVAVHSRNIAYGCFMFAATLA